MTTTQNSMHNISPELLDALCLEDSLVFSVAHLDLLDGKSWSIEDRKWIVEPYSMVNPYKIERDPLNEPHKMAIRKSTQAGISTLSIAKALHFLSYWSVRVGYMLPRQQDISVFSATRLDPTINNSPFLKSKLGQPNSTYTKGIGDSFLYFLEGSVEPRSIPLDLLLLDEVDLCNPDHVGTAINRLDASNWKMTIWLSTPTLPAIGIDSVYEDSDQRQWLVKCPHCGHWQDLDWEKNIRVIGRADEPTSVYYGCQSCDKEITLTDIQEGRWVAAKPSRTKDMVGYHVSQMMTTPARELYSHFRDPKQSLSEFYRKRLGKPYVVAGGSVDREDLLISCFNEPYDIETLYDGDSTYYMGVDQGNQLQVLVGKVESGKRIPKIVHIELIPFDVGFDRVGQLIRIFNVRRCVIDGDPNRHPIKDLQNTFPGRVLMADYVEQRERFVKKIDTRKGRPTYNLPIGVTINRTEGFDDLVKSIKDGLWRLPGVPPTLPQEVEVLIDHTTAIRRDIETRKTQSGEYEVGVWRKLRPEHLAHSWVYLKTAMDMDHQASFRMAVIGSKMPTTEPEKTEAQEQGMDIDEIAAITRRLTEVPVEQMREFLKNLDNPEYTPPFPLGAKLKRLSDYSKDAIVFVLKNLSK